MLQLQSRASHLPRSTATFVAKHYHLDRHPWPTHYELSVDDAEGEHVLKLWRIIGA